MAAKQRKKLGCERRGRGRDKGDWVCWVVSLRSPSAKDKLKQHITAYESHYARPNLLWALSVCPRLASPCSLWFSSRPDGSFFSFHKDLKTERKISDSLCKIVQAWNITEGRIKFLPVSQHLKDKSKSSLVLVAYPGHPQANLSILTSHHFKGSWSFPAPKPSNDVMHLSDLHAHSEISFPAVLSLLPGHHLLLDPVQIHLLKPFLSSGESDCIFSVLTCSVNGHLGEISVHTVPIGNNPVISYWIMNCLNTGIIFIYDLSAPKIMSGPCDVLRKCSLLDKVPVFSE